VIESQSGNTFVLTTWGSHLRDPPWTLAAGWNLVGPSPGATGPISASTVLQGVLQRSGGNLVAIYALRNNQWSPYLLLQRGNAPIGADFALQPGRGYLLYTEEGTSYSPATSAAAILQGQGRRGPTGVPSPTGGSPLQPATPPQLPPP
jgi:hypothetical protein